MEYQQKLIILPVVQDMKKVLNITAYEAVGTGLCYHAVGGDEKYGWVITHLASKKSLCIPIGTEYEVKLIMEKVVELTNWHQDEKILIKKPWVAAEFLKCQRIVKQDLNMQIEACASTYMPEYLVEDIMNEIQDDEYNLLRNALLYAFKIIPSK